MRSVGVVKRFVSRYDQEQLLKVAREKYDDFREVPQDFQVSILKRLRKPLMRSVAL